MSNFTRNDFKISFIDETYFENEKTGTIVCRLKYFVNTPLPWIERVVFPTYYIAIGKAVCSDSDSFEIEKGRKIARAKAESSAYARITRMLGRFYNELSEIQSMGNMFIAKAANVIDHNTAYIDRVDAGLAKKKAKIKKEASHDDNRPLEKVYEKNTPNSHIRVTERILTESEVEQRIKEANEMFNNIIRNIFDY